MFLVYVTTLYFDILGEKLLLSHQTSKTFNWLLIDISKLLVGRVIFANTKRSGMCIVFIDDFQKINNIPELKHTYSDNIRIKI